MKNFKADSYKCANVINYITHCTIYNKNTIELIIYFADRYKLQNSCCTMYKETYQRIFNDYPIIPVCADNIIDDILNDKGNYIIVDHRKDISKQVNTILTHNTMGTKTSIIPIGDYDPNCFSAVDLNCLNNAIEYIFNNNIGDILNKIKDDIIYKQTEIGKVVDFNLLVKSVDIENGNTKENSIEEYLENIKDGN
jgi:hypothetical protein